MIPLVWILLVWLAGVSIFLLLTFLTITLALRFGITGLNTFVFCSVFFVVGIIVIGGTGLLALNVDWSQTINLTPGMPNTSDTLLFP